MGSDNPQQREYSLQSPNAIPPRTSSYGLSNANVSPHASSNGVRHRPSVLRPLSENDWMSQSKKHKHSHSTSSFFPPTSSLDALAHLEAHSNPLPPPTTPPPPEPPRIMADDLIFGKRPAWTEEKERILMGPYNYLYGHPGKDIRSHAIAAFNKWLNVPAASLEVITRVVGMLHTASLLVDDVEDSSLLRRGIPVANRIFGVAQTINSANYVYFVALRELSTLNNPKMIDIFTEELLNLHRGQGMDLYWRDSLTCPSEADYLEMVGNKTGGLFRLAIKLMQAESSVNIDCTPLVSTIGLLFQILDDYLNLSPTSGYADLKGLCEDLTEGKFSFPVIHAIRADPSNQILLNILKQKTQDDEVKRFAIKYMEEKGSFEYCKKVVGELMAKANELVGQIEGGMGEAGREGAAAVRGVLEKFVLK